MSNQQSSTSGASLACIEGRPPTVSFWEKLWKVLRTDLGVAIHNWSMERIARKERNRGAKTKKNYGDTGFPMFDLPVSSEEMEKRMEEFEEKRREKMLRLIPPEPPKPPAPSLDDLLPGARKLYDRILQRIESGEFVLKSGLTYGGMAGVTEFEFEFDNMTVSMKEVTLVGMEADLHLKASVKHSGEMHDDLMPVWAIKSLWDATKDRQEEKQEEKEKTMDQKILELLDS